MPGIHAVIQRRSYGAEPPERGVIASLRASERDIEVVGRGEDYACVFACENYCPRLDIRYEDGFAFLDGIVYDAGDEEVRSRLDAIYRAMDDSAAVRGLVSRFVEDSDGDFIAVVMRGRRWAAFNDKYGRMAFYYYADRTRCALSREMKCVLSFLGAATVDRASVVEYVALRYPLGNKTLFESVYRLEPAEAVFIERAEDGIKFERAKTADLRFDLVDPYRDWEEAQEDLSRALIRSIESRAEAARRHGAGIVADVSGGFDTRTVMSLLAARSQDARYVTIRLATGDESPVAEALWDAMGRPGAFHILDADHAYSIEGVDDLLLDNDGLVNFYTTLVCERDIRALREYVGPGRCFRFSGLGGEFTRHPMKMHSRSLHRGYRFGLYSEQPGRICPFVGVSPREYDAGARDYLDAYPEATRDGRLRRWYYEYYRSFVGAAAEDRERTVIWTVQPLWQKDFLDNVFRRVPLDWTGYAFSTGLLARFDERALGVPIYKRDIDLSDAEGLRAYDAGEAAERRRAQSRLRLAGAKALARKAGYRSGRDRARGSKMIAEALQSIDADGIAGRVFRLPALRDYFLEFPKARTFDQVVTLSRYLVALEEKKGIRISC
jgi:hypothetical protein